MVQRRVTEEAIRVMERVIIEIKHDGFMWVIKPRFGSIKHLPPETKFDYPIRRVGEDEAAQSAQRWAVYLWEEFGIRTRRILYERGSLRAVTQQHYTIKNKQDYPTLVEVNKLMERERALALLITPRDEGEDENGLLCAGLAPPSNEDKRRMNARVRAKRIGGFE